MNRAIHEHPVTDEPAAIETDLTPPEGWQVGLDNDMLRTEWRNYTNEAGDVVREHRLYEGHGEEKELTKETTITVNGQDQKTSESKRYENGRLVWGEVCLYPEANVEHYHDRRTISHFQTEGPEHISKIDMVFVTERGRTPSRPQKLTYDYAPGRLDQKYRHEANYDLDGAKINTIDSYGLRGDRKFQTENHYSRVPGRAEAPEFVIDSYWPGRPDGKVKETNRLDYDGQSIITNEFFELRKDGLVKKITAQHRGPGGEAYAIVNETHRNGKTGEESQRRYYLVDGGQVDELPTHLEPTPAPAVELQPDSQAQAETTS